MTPPEPTDAELALAALWDLWVDGRIDSQFVQTAETEATLDWIWQQVFPFYNRFSYDWVQERVREKMTRPTDQAAVR